jgi:multicomponent K+:H+ antiporter subunit E
MTRLLPAPLLSAALFVLWLLLNQHLGGATLAMAVVLAVAIPLLTAPLRPLDVRIKRPRAMLALVWTVLHDAFVSNLEIARSVWHPTHAPHGAFVRIPLDLHDANGLAMLAIVTTIVPGTVWSELAIDRSAVLLHVFDVDDETAFVSRYKLRYERPLIEIFEAGPVAPRLRGGRE